MSIVEPADEMPSAPGPQQPSSSASNEETPPPPDEERIYCFRLGCVLHVLHIVVVSGLESASLMDSFGKGSWHEWEFLHAVVLLGTVWYLLSKSRTTFAQRKKIVEDDRGVK